MSTFLQDVRFAVRALRQAPVVTLAAVLSLALGIAANVTAFSWMQAVLLRPVPHAADPDRLFLLAAQRRDGRERAWSYPNYRDVRDAAAGFDLVAQDDLSMSVTIDGRAERGYGSLVSGNYFQLMGVGAALGRVLAPSDDEGAGAHPVIVLSHAYWQRRFASDPGIVGRQIVVNNVPLTVVGVAEDGFIGSFFGISTGAWVPMAMQPQMTGADRLERRGDGWLQVFLRPRPGVALAAAQAEASAIAARLATAYPEVNDGLRASVLRPWQSSFGAPSVFAPILAVLSAVAALVLALACANVANLLLARALGRRREVAIRLSLGASRGRLMRQLLTEALVLAVLAGAAGLAVTYWTSGLLMAFVPPVEMPIDLGLRVDLLTFAFAAATSLAAGLLFGLAPAWQASNPDTVHALKEEAGRGASGGVRARRLGGALVVAQVAMCLVLLVAAALFIRSLSAARTLDPGFDTTHQALATIDLGSNGYRSDAVRQFHRRLLERLNALPGVESASLARMVPLGFSGNNATTVAIDGYVPAPGEELVVAYNTVAPRYFETMRVPVLAGREFTDQDDAGRERVTVVNDTMARRYWPAGNAVGARLQSGDRALRVVGVVRDIKSRTLNEPAAPMMYFAQAQSDTSIVTIHARTSGDPAAVLPAIRAAVRELDANVPVFETRTMAEHLGISVFPQRIGATLLGVMGLVALLLATIGLYGVIAYSVGQRRAEMGIRLALGATPGIVRRMVVAQGAWLAGAGIALGLAAAFGAARLLRTLLPGITAADPVTFVLVPIGLALVALAAAWIPARRAAATDPVEALRG